MEMDVTGHDDGEGNLLLIFHCMKLNHLHSSSAWATSSSVAASNHAVTNGHVLSLQSAPPQPSQQSQRFVGRHWPCREQAFGHIAETPIILLQRTNKRRGTTNIWARATRILNVGWSAPFSDFQSTILLSGHISDSGDRNTDQLFLPCLQEDFCDCCYLFLSLYPLFRAGDDLLIFTQMLLLMMSPALLLLIWLCWLYTMVRVRVRNQQTYNKDKGRRLVRQG